MRTIEDIRKNPWTYPGKNTTDELIHIGMGYQKKQLRAILGRGMDRGEVDIGNDSMWDVLKGNSHFMYKVPRRFVGIRKWVKAYVAPNPSGDHQWPLTVRLYRN